MNDKETATSAENLANAADKVKDAFDSAPATSLPKPDKEAIKKAVELLRKQADTVKSRTSNHQPATAEMKQVVVQAGAVQKLIDAHPVPAATTSWEAVQSSLAKLRQAFNL